MGTLYLCATPIGNLEDITLRVLRTLKEVDLIAAEDTRQTIKLLNHFDIKTPLTSYHEHNKYQKTGVLVNELLAGKNIAVVTDAGTPAISDPGAAPEHPGEESGRVQRVMLCKVAPVSGAIWVVPRNAQVGFRPF